MAQTAAPVAPWQHVHDNGEYYGLHAFALHVNTSNTSTNDSVGGDGFSLQNTCVWIMLYSVAVLLSAFCNVAVLIVQLCGRHCKTDLRPFLVSLACSDLQMGLFCIPFTSTYTLMRFNWIFPQAVCKMVLFLQCTAVASSVFTNIAIGLDRLVAVLAPLRSRVSAGRTKVALALIWVVAVTMSSIQFFVGDKFYDPYTGTWRCEEKNWPEPQSTYSTVYTWFLFSVTYAIPLSALTVTYSIVGCKLWNRSAPGNANAVRDSRQVKTKIKLVKMLATIVVCFGLNWLPIYLFFILREVPEIYQLFEAYPIVALNTYNCCHWLAMSNSFVNFWIYLFMNRAFRIDFLTLICRRKKQRYAKPWTTAALRRSTAPTSSAEKTLGRLDGLNSAWRSASTNSTAGRSSTPMNNNRANGTDAPPPHWARAAHLSECVPLKDSEM